MRFIELVSIFVQGGASGYLQYIFYLDAATHGNCIWVFFSIKTWAPEALYIEAYMELDNMEFLKKMQVHGAVLFNCWHYTAMLPIAVCVSL